MQYFKRTACALEERLELTQGYSGRSNSKNMGESLDNTVILSGAEGRAPQGVQAVHQDQGTSQVLPSFGYWVLHLVQTQM